MKYWKNGLILFAVLILITLFLLLAWGLFWFFEPENGDVQESSKYYNNNTNKSDIIVTFTTMPDRLKSKAFKHTLCSMLSQSVRPQEIRLNLPYRAKRTGAEYVLPEWLDESVPIHIARCEDEGPATKYLSTFRDHKETIDQKILIWDDDTIMPFRNIETYGNLTKTYPDTAIGGRGVLLKRYFDDKNTLTHTSTTLESISTTYVGKLNALFKTLRTPNRETVSVPNSMKFQKVDILQGCGGICIQPKMVDPDRLSDFKNMPKSAFFVDDIVISGHLAENKISRIVCSEIVFPRLSVSASLESWIDSMKTKPATESLSHSANKIDNNNEVMIQHFFSKWGKEPI